MTSSLIGVMHENGEIEAVTCIHDGFIEQAGLILQIAYNDLNIVRKLISNGDIESLGVFLDDINNDIFKNNHTIFYVRDYGENNFENTKLIFSDIYSFHNAKGIENINYIYDEKNKKWLLLQRENGFNTENLYEVINNGNYDYLIKDIKDIYENGHDILNEITNDIDME